MSAGSMAMMPVYGNPLLERIRSAPPNPMIPFGPSEIAENAPPQTTCRKGSVSAISHAS